MKNFIAIASLILLSGCDSSSTSANYDTPKNNSSSNHITHDIKNTTTNSAAADYSSSFDSNAGYNQEDADYVRSIGMSPSEAREAERMAAGDYKHQSIHLAIDDPQIAAAQARVDETYAKIEANEAAIREIDAKIASLHGR